MVAEKPDLLNVEYILDYLDQTLPGSECLRYRTVPPVRNCESGGGGANWQAGI
jgi:hypothetical protein